MVTFLESQIYDPGGPMARVGLVYAGLAALCCWALVRKRRRRGHGKT